MWCGTEQLPTPCRGCCAVPGFGTGAGSVPGGCGAGSDGAGLGYGAAPHFPPCCQSCPRWVSQAEGLDRQRGGGLPQPPGAVCWVAALWRQAQGFRIHPSSRGNAARPLRGPHLHCSLCVGTRWRLMGPQLEVSPLCAQPRLLHFYANRRFLLKLEEVRDLPCTCWHAQEPPWGFCWLSRGLVAAQAESDCGCRGDRYRVLHWVITSFSLFSSA